MHFTLKMLMVMGIIIAIPISIYVGIMLEFGIGFGTGANTSGIFVLGVPVAVIAFIVWLLRKNRARRDQQYHSRVRRQVMSELDTSGQPLPTIPEDIILHILSECGDVSLDELLVRTKLDKDTLLPILGSLLREQAITQRQVNREAVFSING